MARRSLSAAFSGPLGEEFAVIRHWPRSSPFFACSAYSAVPNCGLMSLGVMGVVEREIVGPIPRFGDFQNGSQELRILRGRLKRRYFDAGALRQLRLRREPHHAVPDCAFVAHAHYLPEAHPWPKRGADLYRVFPARSRGGGFGKGEWLRQFPRPNGRKTEFSAPAGPVHVIPISAFQSSLRDLLNFLGATVQ